MDFPQGRVHGTPLGLEEWGEDLWREQEWEFVLIFFKVIIKKKERKEKILSGNPESQKVLDTYASDTKDHRCKHRLLYPAKLSISINTEDILKPDLKNTKSNLTESTRRKTPTKGVNCTLKNTGNR